MSLTASLTIQERGTIMELSLTGEDLEILVRSLEYAIQETASEARRSDTRAYRDRLNWEKKRLSAILTQLKEEAALAAEGQRGFDLLEYRRRLRQAQQGRVCPVSRLCPRFGT
jgi:hypothetical protein